MPPQPPTTPASGDVRVGSGSEVGGSPGDFDSSLVTGKIRQRLGGIRACYERALRNDPTIRGGVTIEFAVEERGNVSGVNVVTNTIDDAAVGECVANEIKRIPTFNPGPDGGKVVFSYPFTFSPAP